MTVRQENILTFIYRLKKNQPWFLPVTVHWPAADVVIVLLQIGVFWLFSRKQTVFVRATVAFFFFASLSTWFTLVA